MKSKIYKSIFEEAAEIVRGPRRKSYGPVEESFQRLAYAFSAVLLHKLKAPLSPREAGLILESLKVCREANAPHRDNRVDGCGYWDLIDQLPD